MQVKKVMEGKKVLYYEAVADGPRDPLTGKRNQIRRRAKGKAEVQRKVDMAIKKLEEKHMRMIQGIRDPAEVQQLTFSDVADMWYEEYRRSGVKKNTHLHRKDRLKQVNKMIGDKKLIDINREVFQNVIFELSDRYERNTVMAYISTAKLVFKYAKKSKLINEMPSEDTFIPKKQLTVEEIEHSNQDEKYFTHDEIKLFLDTVNDKGLELDKERFFLLLFTGLRSGEMSALKWSDIDFNTQMIRVTKTLYNAKGRMEDYELTSPKTHGSVRVVPINDEIAEMLREHRRNQFKMMDIFSGFGGKVESENFVFARENGLPFRTYFTWKRMNRIMKLSGIKKEASPHMLRHTFISMMTEAGVDLATIMNRVGHEDAKTTLKIYTHVTEKMQTDATEKMGQFYSNMLKIIQ
ncbi:tyrosine-type recombinase/integrase [Jeotgalibacillus haloalkalitolerans]|uniref:Tyrosine-type recombinase/integrase n=1 Tax=Jeotgalibacillus haloalkalitolerans TaxID=3104292 RepID=A0ABU5KK31_9BACL|nr:tyrosine-type recombinase/integrase [Jeotgalibacillus sp. HH7-29]MDZ5711608.1 tyrosine-type recombinase/integrase [Jeotgalibacillus sp. HH7-29]